jgi:hypothetical protein
MKTAALTTTNGLEENTFQIMLANTPMFAFFFLGAVISGFIVYCAMKLYARFQKVENAVPDHATRVAELEKWRHESEANFASLHQKVDFILNFLIEKHRSNNNP